VEAGAIRWGRRNTVFIFVVITLLMLVYQKLSNKSIITLTITTPAPCPPPAERAGRDHDLHTLQGIKQIGITLDQLDQLAAK